MHTLTENDIHPNINKATMYNTGSCLGEQWGVVAQGDCL